MKLLAAAFLLLTTLNTIASTKLKVMEINNNAGSVYGLRLNEKVNTRTNPLARDAEFECSYEDEIYVIVFCDRGLCDPEDGDVFYSFDNPTHCFETQKELKKKFKAGKSACLVSSSKSLAILDGSACK